MSDTTPTEAKGAWHELRALLAVRLLGWAMTVDPTNTVAQMYVEGCAKDLPLFKAPSTPSHGKKERNP